MAVNDHALLGGGQTSIQVDRFKRNKFDIPAKVAT